MCIRDRNRAEVSLNEEKIKKVLTKYAQLKDAFGIDRNTVSLKECADLFSTGNMLYTVLDADSLAEINVTDVDYGICEYQMCIRDSNTTGLMCITC